MNDHQTDYENDYLNPPPVGTYYMNEEEQHGSYEEWYRFYMEEVHFYEDLQISQE